MANEYDVQLRKQIKESEGRIRGNGLGRGRVEAQDGENTGYL